MIKKLNKLFYSNVFKPFVEDKLKGHIAFNLFNLRFVVYGFNAMHVAINVNTYSRYGYICFHPPMYCYGTIWPWYFYISENATPGEAWFALGNPNY